MAYGILDGGARASAFGARLGAIVLLAALAAALSSPSSAATKRPVDNSQRATPMAADRTTVAAPPRGFVAAFDTTPAADGRLALRRLAATTSTPGPRTRELDPSRDWHVRWLDADGATLADAPVPDPSRPLLGSADRRQPLFVRFEDRPAAVLVELRDAHGTLRGEVPLDASSRGAAERLRLRGESARAVAARRAAKRSDVGPARRAQSARTVQYQVAVQQLLDARREARCGGRAGWRIPERVIDDACRAGSVSPTARPLAASPPSAAPRLSPAAKPAPVAAAIAPPPPPLPRSRDPRHGLPIVRPAVDGIDRPRPAKASSRPAVDYVTLTGKLLFPDGSAPPTGPVTMYTWGAAGNGSAYVIQAHPPGFAYSSPVVLGEPVTVQIVSPAPYLPKSVPLGPIAVDTYREIALERGVAVSGRVKFPAGATPPAEPFQVALQTDAGQWYGVQATGPDFAFAHAFPAGTGVRVPAMPPSPFLAREIDLGVVAADRVVDVAVPRGVLVKGHVVGPASYFVHVRDVTAGDQPSQWNFTTPDFEVALPAVGAAVEVDATGYFPSAPFQPVGGADADVEFVLRPLPDAPNVTLTLYDGPGNLLKQARAEAWQGGRVVTSAVSDAAGVASLKLADGDYEIRVWPDTEQANQWTWDTTKLFAEPAIVAPLSVAGTTSTLLAVPDADWLEMRVVLPVEAPFPDCNDTPFGRLELVRDGLVVARGAFRDLYSYPFPGGGHRLITGRGMYSLRYAMPGGVQWLSAPFRATAGGTITLTRVGSAPQNLWTGTLRDHAGSPLPQRDIRLGDELGITLWPACPVRTDAAGKFRVPLCEGCTYSFEASAAQASQRRTLRVDGPVAASRELDVRLGAPLAFSPLAPSGASRVFGHADAPFRLIFLAEGYVAEQETFTDTNGNGLWDGVQWVDVNGDGKFNVGEQAAAYGNAAWPNDGTDPRPTNEPFQDLNGDGVLSVDDRALFERNVRDYLRGLFSSDQFAAYRGAYQASALMTYSAQAGMDHGPIARDTLFGVQYEPDRGLLSVDYGAAYDAASDAEPGFTVVVVMINQPVPYGRVNSFVLASGGVLGGDVNDNVAGHEFGHNPGGLADEYSEFAGAYVGADPGSPNSTRFVERGLVPWGGRVSPLLDGRPTKPWFAREGFFEGSSYQSAGAFRPAQASMMRYMDSLLFNGASVDQLARVHARALRDTPGRLTLSGETRACREYEAAWDVAALGVASVELRGGAHDGPVLGGGGATGSAWLKPLGVDLYLVDAADGVVLDLAAVPMIRCAGH